jgi:SAM-dependent methyltransferase
MHELLRHLPPGARVLDLGCGGGSFGSSSSPFVVIPVDLQPRATRPANLTQADAAKLPFKAACFDTIISNHSLEHFENLRGALEEIGRVSKPTGSLFVAVPDASTITDRIYRWLARGGGHVNPFVSAEEFASNLERATGLRHVGTRTLCTSAAFLNRKNLGPWPPWRLFLLGGGSEASLWTLNYLWRMCDRFFGTRLSVYGWAFYFGDVQETICPHAWTNVCIRCGSGASSDWLMHEKLVTRRWLFRVYRCPDCGTMNVFTDDRHYRHLDVPEPRSAPGSLTRNASAH